MLDATAGNLHLGTVSAATGAGQIEGNMSLEASGNVYVGSVSTGTDSGSSVTIQATGGSTSAIIETGTQPISTFGLHLSATSDVGSSAAPILTEVNNLVVSSSQGSAYVTQPTTGSPATLNLSQSSAANDLTVTNDNGGIAASSVGGNSLALTASGNIQVQSVAVTGPVSLDSTGGGITETGASPLLSTGALTLQSQSDIGSATTGFATSVSSISANSSAGNVYIAQSGVPGTLAVTQADANAGGTVSILNTGGGIQVGTGGITGGTIVLNVSGGASNTDTISDGANAGRIQTGALNLTAPSGIGTSHSSPLSIDASSLIANSSAGNIYVSQQGSGNVPLTLTQVAASGAGGVADITNTIGDLQVTSVSTGANGSVLLTASATGSTITDTAGASAIGTGTLTVQADGNIGTAGSGGALLTNVTNVSTVSNSGSVYLAQPSGSIDLTTVSAGAGQVASITSGGTITVDSVAAPGGTVDLNGTSIVDDSTNPSSLISVGATGTVNLTAAGAIGGSTPLAVSGGTLNANTTANISVASQGDITLGTVTASGATSSVSINAGSNGSIDGSAGTLTASSATLEAGGSIGALGAPVNTAVGTLGADAVAGNIYISQAGPVELTNAIASQTVNIQSSGQLTVDSATAQSVTLSGSSIVDNGSASIPIFADTLDLTATNGSIGTSATGGALQVTATTVTANATGNVYLQTAQSLALQDITGGAGDTVQVISTGGNITAGAIGVTGSSGSLALAELTAQNGSILDDSNSSTQVVATNLQLSATGAVGSAADPLGTNTQALTAASGTGNGIYIANLGNLIASSVNSGGDAQISTTGDLSVVSISAQNEADLTATGSIENGTGSGPINAVTLSMVAGNSIGSLGAIATDATNVSAQSTHGGVALDATSGGVILSNISAGGGDAVVTAAADMSVGTLSASGAATLTSQNGSINAASGSSSVSGQTVTLNAAVSIGASGAALPTAAGILSADAGNGGIYITQSGAFTLASALAPRTNSVIDITDTTGDMTVGTVTASATGSVSLTAQSGAILAETGNPSQISGGAGVALTAATDVGTVTDFATLTGTPVNVSTTGLMSVTAQSNSGQINLDISGSPVIGAGAIKLGNGTGVSGTVVLQSPNDLNVDGLAAGAISIGSGNTASVGLSSGGTLTLPTNDVVTDAPPRNLFVQGVTDVIDSGGSSPREFSFTADELSFHSGAAGETTILNTQVSQLDASVGTGSTLTVNQSGGQNLALGSIAALSGTINITASNSALMNDGIPTDTVTANNVVLAGTAVGASGSGNAINTLASSVSATATTGDVYLAQGSGALALTASAAGGNIGVTAGADGLTLDSVNAAGTVSLSTTGSIVAAPGNQVSANTLSVNAAGIGSSTAGPLNTEVATLDAISGSGGIYVSNAGPLGLTATATGGPVNVQTSGDLALTSVQGVDVALAAGGAITSNGGQVVANMLTATGASIGDVNAPLATAVSTVVATANSGDIYLQNTGSLNLTASAPSGTVQVSTPNASMSVASVTGNNVNLTVTGAGNSLTLDGPVNATNEAQLTSSGAIVGGTGNLVSASDSVFKATTIGANGATLNVGSGSVDAATTNGGIFLTSTGPGVLTLSAAATNGPVNVQTTSGGLTVTSASGDGVVLGTTGAASILTVNGVVNGGAGNVSLTTTGTGSDIALNDTVKTTGEIVVAASGNIAAGSGNSLSAGTVDLDADEAIGGSAVPVNTSAPTLSATSRNGGIYLNDTAGVTLTASATGGPLDVQSGGLLTVSSASGAGVTLTAANSSIDVDGALSGDSGPVVLTAGGAGGNISLDGVLSTSGDVTLSAGTTAAPGTIMTGAGGEVMGAALTATGSALGTAANPLNTSVGSLTTTSLNGGTYINELDGVALSSTATGGTVNVQTNDGSITVNGASAIGVTLIAGGAGSGITVNGAINGGSGGVTLTAGTTSGPGSIAEGSGGSVTGTNLTATGASIGSVAATLLTNINTITANASQGGIYVTNQSGLTLASVQSSGDASVTALSGNLGVQSVNVGGTATLTASDGTIADVATNSSPLEAKSLTLLARSIGAPSTLTATGVDFSPRLNIDAGTLDATSTAGGIYINALGSNGLSSVTVHASGGSSGNLELLAPQGSLYLQSVSASNTLLLAAGLNIYGLPGLGSITAQSAELRAGAANPSTGHIGTPTDPLSLRLNPGNTLRIFVPQTVDYHDPSRAPATLPSTDVVTTLSLYAAPSDLAVEAGYGQFQGLSDSLYTSPAESLVHSIQNQTTVLQNVVGLDWGSFNPNISLFGTLDPSVCLPSDQRDEESGPPGCGT